ncbi:glyoxylase-like metal-dependent hydrolase (beta-lactamase superfamily II) [Catenulispora sp. GP43]|uniref:MBL fold metallo-hydrolase n=1 Tax=Catenulispora sp. GP43 TaxID=3156263 RepID=UPI003518BF8A
MTPSPASSADRRSFLIGAATVLTVPAAAGLLGTVGSGTAHAGTDAAPGLPDFAPVPTQAFGPALNVDGYYVGRISGDLYWVTDGYYQAMFLSTPRGVVVVDAPPTIGHNLLRAIDDVTRANGRPAKVTHVIYSHSHADHIGAAALLGGPDTIRIAHADTAALLARDADPQRPAPTVTFKNRYEVEVGGEHLVLEYHGPNHAPGNIFIHAPNHDTLMVVDVLFPGWAPFANLAFSSDVPDWVSAHNTALDYSWQTLVGGHLGRLGTRSDAQTQLQYVNDLRSSVQAAISSVDPTEFFAKYGPTGNAWAIFKTYLSAVAETAAAPVVAKYTGVLAAADVYTIDNAYTMVESLRIDGGALGPFGIRA